MALRISSARKSSSLGALFVSNPKKKRVVRKRKNAPKRKRKTTSRKRKSTKKRTARKPARRIVLKMNPLRMKKRKTVKKRKNGTKKGMVRKTARKAYVKRRKNGTKKGMRRKTARRAYMKRRNPAHKRKSSKRVVRRIIRNPAMEIKALRPVKKLVNKLPIVKKVAPYLGASVIGMAVVVPYNWAYGKVSAYIQSSQMPAFVKNTEKYAGLALTGLGVAVLTNYLLGMSKLVSKQTAKNSAIAIAVLSGGAQFLKLKEMYDAGELKLPFISKKDDATAGLAYMGDGMAYDVVPMGGMHMNGAMYHDASALDATQAPHDLDAKEKAMALRGASAWMQCWGECPHRASSHDGSSRYAGKHGHRWGWLIKVLGWDRFAKLCKMSAPDRIRAISQIKIACINSAQKSFDSSSYSGLAIDMGGLAYSQDSFAGLAMVGSAH